MPISTGSGSALKWNPDPNPDFTGVPILKLKKIHEMTMHRYAPTVMIHCMDNSCVSQN